jgi:4-aminobutyrate aminotransferase-like enzyme
VLDVIKRQGLIERVRGRGARLRDELEQALVDVSLVAEVPRHGYLLGIEYADPNDGTFLPPELRLAAKIDDLALERGLVILYVVRTVAQEALVAA